MNIELLLSHADDQRPVIGDGLPMDAAGTAPRPQERQGLENFRHDGGDPNSLPEQRWGLVVPEGTEGDRLLELVAPLRKAREEQQGELVIVFRAPPGLSGEEVGTWWSEVYGDEDIDEANRPRYLLMLGDADRLSWELQQRLASDTFIGRICFPDDAGYEAYVHKLLAAEREVPAAGSRALYYTVRDGTAATTIGHAGLMTPTIEQSRLGREKGAFNARAVVEIGDGDNVSADDFFAAASDREPSMLFSISHGCGAPRAGWANTEDQRRLQGAMSFGGGVRITAEEMASRPFLPGGLWFFFACFGAGTPSQSAYHHWLAALRDIGLYGRNIDSVLKSLPNDEERPFVAALPQAALANPNGPLAVMGHVDLAWTFSFHDVGMTNKYRPSRFQDIFRTLVDGKRVGAGYFELQRYFNQASVDLSTLYDNDARMKVGGAAAEDDKARKVRKATLWMLRQDLSAYVLIGDPAARLNIEGPLARQAPRATSEQLEARRTMARPLAAPPAEDPAAASLSAQKAEPAQGTAFAALSDAALDALAAHFDVPRAELDQLLATMTDASLIVPSAGLELPHVAIEESFGLVFADDDGLPWHDFAVDSGRPQAGNELPDDLVLEIARHRAAIPPEPDLKPWSKGHMHFGHKDKAHHAYLSDYFSRRAASASPEDRRKILAFRAFQGREGSTAAINSYDNQIVTWGTGWAGLGGMGKVVERALASQAARDLFGHCGVRYRGRNTYDVVDLEAKRVVSGQKEGLEAMRRSLPLLCMLIHAARAPETRDAVTEAQLAMFIASSGDITGADAVATQALFNLIAHLRHWAPGYATGCLQWALPRVSPGAPSIERDKRLAVLVGRYFYGKARPFKWIPDWKQFQLYWKHMKEDGLDCLNDPFIKAPACPASDPFGSAPVAPAAPQGAKVTASALKSALLAGSAVLQAIASGRGVLQKGARGAGVQAVQKALLSLKQSVPGGADGVFGEGLESAVKAFQASRGLPEDGIVGRGTLEAIDSALGG